MGTSFLKQLMRIANTAIMGTQHQVYNCLLLPHTCSITSLYT